MSNSLMKYLNHLILSVSYNEHKKADGIILERLQKVAAKLLLSFTVNLKKSSYIPGETLDEDLIRL